MFPEFEQSSLLVHIAFHYVPERIQYLEQVLAAIDAYPLARIQVVIDTNTEASERQPLTPRAPGVSLRMDVHDELRDPYRLTWQHRSDVEANLSEFDYFMYLEDDIVVPAAALVRWRDDSRQLYPLGHLRGFVRVERNEKGTLVSTDQKKQARLDHFLSIGGRAYYAPANPYHGFWIYDRAQMRDFVGSQCWLDGNHGEWGVRECAAAGMLWRERSGPPAVVPLDADGSIPSDVLVHHVPNNYALDEKDRKFGNIPIARLTRMPLWDRLKQSWHGYRDMAPSRT